MSLQYFEKFIPKNNEEIQSNKNVWVYTRVSSKDQEMNKSLAYQKKYAEEYASKNNLTITEYFGATFESAKGDFTRKEFTKLIDYVSKTKNRPYAILIYKMNRFSRSGGSAIGLSHKLVHDKKVHLIEVCSEVSTETEEGELQIHKRLLTAKKENLERMEHTLPGMKAFLEAGNYLGKPPMGYTLKGTRVSDFNRRSETQKMEINNDGKLLKKAWLMKVNGEKDFIIRKELERYGLKVSKQKISAMWRKTTYCGISTNKLLDSPVKGSWKPIVSVKNFMKIQEILNKPKEGYTIGENIDRPLTGFIKCISCGNKLTSYEVKKKKLHYYTCQKCKGMTLNANSTKKALKKGVHNAFVDLLESYKLSEELIEPFKAQLKLIYTNSYEDKYELQELVKKQLGDLKKKSKNLTEKLINGVIDDVTYKEYKTQFDSDMLKLNQKIKNQDKKISNLDEFIDSISNFSQNISKQWSSGEYETKLKLQELVFPSGLVIDPKNRQYLTKEINSIFVLKSVISRDSESIENKKASKNAGFNDLVAGTGLEPVTFGL